MLALAKKVRFYSPKVCSVRVVDMQPKWKNLSISAAWVNLEVEDTAALVRNLDNFWVVGVTALGFPSLSMMDELHQSDRKCSVNRLTRQRVELRETVEGTPPGFSFGTLLDNAAQSRFEELMWCGCSSCLTCLSREGKLSRDSQSPDDCGYVPVYEY